MSERIKFKGKIRPCIYNSENFKIYPVDVDVNIYPQVKLTQYGTATLTGDMHELAIGQEYEITAVETESKYGISYKVINIRKDQPKTEADVFEFLQEILTFNQAAELYKSYPDIIERVNEGRLDDVDLSKLHRIGEKTFEKIVQKIEFNYGLYDLVVEFNGVLTIGMLKKLYEKYPSVMQLKKALLKEPYKCLCGLSRVGFITADHMLLELERTEKFDFGFELKSSPQRCMACMKYILEKNQEDGHTKMKLSELRNQIRKLVPACFEHFKDCVLADDIHVDKNNLEYVSLKRTYEQEMYIAETIIESLEHNIVWDYDWKQYKTAGEFVLSDEQLELLHVSCEKNSLILEGAAGVGKSASVSMLIKMLKDNGKTFVMMTPTGKSAKVLTDFAQEQAMTIHRALGYKPDVGFLYNKDNKLDVDVVLIDEFSMVSVPLMVHVLDAIDFKKTKLIVIGDSNQLPSVEYGNLMHDFLACNLIPKVTLTKVFRYGSNGLLTVATDIRQSTKFLQKSYKQKLNPIGDKKDYVFITSSDKSIVNDALQIYKKLIYQGYNGVKYQPSDIAVLTAYNKGDYGVEELNKKLQRIANPNYGTTKCFTYGSNVYYIGDILLQKQNNYKAVKFTEDFTKDEETTFIANGECSVVTDIIKNSIVHECDGEKIIYSANDLNSVDLGYSYSIHKSQGSTIKAVILLTPRAHTYMLTSNLLYVAITRTSECCFHFGDPATIDRAIKLKENYKRNTYMQELLVV